MFVLLIFAVLILGIVFLALGIRAFSQIRKYYKNLADFNICDVDFMEEGDEECTKK